MPQVTSFGDISPRTAAYTVAGFLKRGAPHMVIEKFGQVYPLPQHNSLTAKFRRYFLTGSTGAAGSGSAAAAWGIPVSLTPLVEGVTPSGRKLANQDYTVQLAQYGDFMTITDVVMDVHEDPVLQQATEVLGESAALTIETIRFNVLKAGTNVFYANGGARNAVNTAPTQAMQRQVTTALLRQNAKRITNVVKSTPDYRTEPVEAAFIALHHPDLDSDIRNMTGFISTKQYGTVTPFENETGAVEMVRYLNSTVFAPWADAGGAKGAMRSTSGTSADVYPILFLARDAFGIVPLKGKDALTPMVVNPKPAAGDPLGQRGTVGWKCYTACVILNDAWMARLEVAATA
jgi:N4-gp56 family major capsid protein